MMTDRQLGFRKEYRSRIAGWYNGYLHILVVYAIGLTALYIYTSHIDIEAGNNRVNMEA